MKCVLRILNSLGPTSNILDRFVIGIAEKCPSYFQVVLVLDSPVDTEIEVSGSNFVLQHCHGNKRTFISSCIDFIRRTDDARLVHIHHPRAGLLYKCAEIISGKSLPKVLTIHSSFDKYSLKTKFATKTLVSMVDKVTFVSDYALEAFAHSAREKAGNKYVVIKNGIDIKRIRHKNIDGNGSMKEEAGNSYSMITVGRLIRDKNQGFLIRLLSTLPDKYSLTIVGDGSERKKLHELANRLGVSSRVSFTGYVQKDVLYELFRISDLFLSSSYREGLPISVLEALALECPVVLSDIGPHREIMTMIDEGSLLSNNLELWKERVIDMLERQKQRTRFVAHEAAKTVDEQYSLDRMIEKFSSIYGLLI